MNTTFRTNKTFTHKDFHEEDQPSTEWVTYAQGEFEVESDDLQRFLEMAVMRGVTLEIKDKKGNFQPFDTEAKLAEIKEAAS